MKYIIIALVISMLDYALFIIYNVSFNIALWSEEGRWFFSFTLLLGWLTSVMIYLSEKKF